MFFLSFPTASFGCCISCRLSSQRTSCQCPGWCCCMLPWLGEEAVGKLLFLGAGYTSAKMWGMMCLLPAVTRTESFHVGQEESDWGCSKWYRSQRAVRNHDWVLLLWSSTTVRLKALHSFLESGRQIIAYWDMFSFCWKLSEVWEGAGSSSASSCSAASRSQPGNCFNLVTSAWALALQCAPLQSWQKMHLKGRRNIILLG